MMFRDIIVSPFLFGIFSSIGICLASCTPILVSYLISTKRDWGRFLGQIVFFALVRVVTFTLTMVILFIVGDLALEFIREHTLVLRIIGGSFICAMGILVFFNKHLNLRFFKTRSKGLFLLALLFGVKPCLPHIAMWGYVVVAAEDVLQSAMVAAAFSLGENITPIVIGFFGGKAIRYLRGRAYRIASKIGGAVIFILGIVFILYD